jgi:hypothetical protein
MTSQESTPAQEPGLSGNVHELDFTLRQLDDQERQVVQGILEAQSIPYVLADDVMQNISRTITVPIEDFSPPPAVLQDHYASIAEEDAGSDEDTADLEQTVIDDASELRLYPVRLASQSEEDPPRPVVISWRDRLVVGFTSG